jgi:hypothetical protein
MAWLISYRYVAVSRRHDGKMWRSEATDGIDIIEEHPAEFLAKSKRRLAEMESGLPLERADDIKCIYSVIEIPDEATAAMLRDDL